MYLRQIVHESEDVINLSAGCLRKTNTGNDSDILLAVYVFDQPSQDLVCLHLPIIHTFVRYPSSVYLHAVTGFKTEDRLGAPSRIQTPNCIFVIYLFLQ